MAYEPLQPLLNERIRGFDPAAAWSRRPPLGLFLFLMVIFFITEHDFYYSLMDHYSPVAEEYAERVYEGNPIRRVSFIILGIYGIISLLRKWGTPLRINGLQGWVIIFYIIWSIASIAWSIDTMLTFRRLVLFAMLCVGALAVARRFTYRDFVLFTFICSATYLAIGLFAEITLGTFRPGPSWYRFSGTVHPNTQAIHGALLYISARAFMIGASRSRRYALIGVQAIAIILMLLTKSRTGTAAAILAPVGFWALHLRGRHKFMVFSVLMVILTSTALLRDVSFPTLQKSIQLQRDDVTSQSDATLTGRIPLWIDAFHYIARRPVLGYGYGAFWIPENILDIAALHAWAPNQGHSSYIDRLLDLGIVGFLGFVLVYTLGIRQAYVQRYHFGRMEYQFLGAVLIFCVLDSLLESIILHPNYISFISMVALAHLGFQRPDEAPGSMRDEHV
jgi:exopolysaccharide production protein ExoQ